ncbi:hypothetical protein C1645_735269 [Glomus cerebriforme]|uniref:BTB/POZ protein n=1 Tax=Glomus cerebriforme TaxID=658196 RepID=A0A397T6E1_9GLOM|nr:hypothetical protein C1645_735269 [Glomus cerebriforme]
MALLLYSGLSIDLSVILKDADDFNVIIQVGENENTKEFRAHSVILRARSPYFKSALSADWISNKNDMIIFNKPNITPTVFEMILKYIYTGELDLRNQSAEDIFRLLIASDELLFEELFECIQDYLIEKQTSWIQKNFEFVLRTVFKLTGCKKLQDYCLEFLCAVPKPFITSKNFTLLDENILYSLLKRDDIMTEEVVVWDGLIKWGIEQAPGLGSENCDKTKWNNENYEALKKTLDKFIPFIRFTNITSDDFFDKVRPYKAIIPHDIYEEIEEFYYKKTLPKTIILPPRTATLVSTIIRPNLATIISNWIDKNVPITINNKYKFNLIYLMSRDGYDEVAFSNKCKEQGPYVVLIRVQSEKIYGGYNAIGYKIRNRWFSSTESFIFSFENNQDINHMKILDGDFFFIIDQCLRIGYNSLHYDNVFDKCQIPIEEIEIFSIVNK